jgi:hypothetical protein
MHTEEEEECLRKIKIFKINLQGEWLTLLLSYIFGGIFMKKFRRYSKAILASAIAETLIFGGGCLGAESITKVKVPAKLVFAGGMFLGAVDSAYRVYKIHKCEREKSNE